MSENTKNLDATTMRMAGNICAGLLGSSKSPFLDETGVCNHQELVAISVDLARRIVSAQLNSLQLNSPEAKSVERMRARIKDWENEYRIPLADSNLNRDTYHGYQACFLRCIKDAKIALDGHD